MERQPEYFQFSLSRFIGVFGTGKITDNDLSILFIEIRVKRDGVPPLEEAFNSLYRDSNKD